MKNGGKNARSMLSLEHLSKRPRPLAPFLPPLLRVRDFSGERLIVVICPFEAHTPLLVNADAELPLPIAPQSLKAVTWQLHQVELTSRNLKDV